MVKPIDPTFFWILGLIFTILMGIAGFFFHSLVKKLDKGQETLNHIDKSLAVMAVEIKNHDKRIEALERDKEHKEREISRLKDKLEEVGGA